MTDAPAPDKYKGREEKPCLHQRCSYTVSVIVWLRLPAGLGAGASVWIGALLAQANGYPVRPLATVAATLLALALLIFMSVQVGCGRQMLSSALGGWGASMAGYALNSGHWAAEVLVLGVLLSLSLFLVSLSQDFLRLGRDQPAGRLSLISRTGVMGGALLYTLVNIVVIVGLVVCILLPATPLPHHQVLWGVILIAVVNQELIKRRLYRQPRYHLRLWGLSAIAYLTLVGAFLVIAWGRQ